MISSGYKLIHMSDLQHRGWVCALGGKLCLAPVKETANVLDIGTGTGIWAIEFARKYPNSKASDVLPGVKRIREL